jgi:hypothetical protein
VGNHREVDVYVDAAGRSDVRDELARLAREDKRGFKTVQSRIQMLRLVTLQQALESKLIKQPSGTIYVLRVQSGPVSYRLPFFEVPGSNGKLVILTHLAARTTLRGDRYKALIQSAERRREDWIRRNCKGGG